MVFKRFFYISLLTALALATLGASFNIYMDEFGLFRDVKNRELRIFTSERLAKYLFTFHYIPAKFNGLILGPSLSDILDPKQMSTYHLYNLSLTGGNIAEMNIMFENVIRRGGKIKVLVLCLDPFITRKPKMEELELTPRLALTALGSTSFFKFYKEKERALHNKNLYRDMSKNSEWGRYHYIIFRSSTPQQAIEERAEDIRKNGIARPEAWVGISGDAGRTKNGISYSIDPAALAELKEMVALARKNNIRILAYYHPYPQKIFEQVKGPYQSFQRTLNEVFGTDDVIYDFNADRYESFRSDYTNYLDTVHVSDKGASFLAGELDRILREKFPPATLSCR